MQILQNINGHDDLADLSDEQRELLCQEIRQFLISSVSRTGGHLASNLGAVELSVAIETVFNTMKDRLVFDVGHQSYVHKMLTGRQADFEHLRQFGGMSGFPKPYESPSDAFVAGHASSSVSIALGMARARTLQKQDYNVIALIGDGACTGGMAYEAMADVAFSREPMIIILNDNAMSIDRNVGGFAKHLSRLRSKDHYLEAKRRYRNLLRKIPGGKAIYNVTHWIKVRVKRLLLPATLFDNLGLKYLGPVDGHDLPGLIRLLRSARDLQEPVVVHVTTQKGRGYAPAEQHPRKFHGVGKFDPLTGEMAPSSGVSFSQSFGDTLTEMAAENPKICAITAAMPSGTGLSGFKKAYPNRTFDVGIAEEHAVSMAGGLAKQGMIPVVALYSTFLQRAYDQILQDTAMLRLHVVYAVDRAGLVGEDGETHHGVFDVGFLRQAPGMTVLAPASLQEQQDMLHWAIEDCDGPVAIRYPRGGNRGYDQSEWQPNPAGVAALHRSGDDVTLVTYGTMYRNVMAAAELLEQGGIHAAVVRLLTVSPINVDAVIQSLGPRHRVIVAEEACRNSGIGQTLAYEIRKQVPDARIDIVDLGHRFATHGNVDTLYEQYGLDGESIAAHTREVLRRES